jgi:hypothetical protein
MKREANAKKLLDKADEEGKVTFEIFTEDPRLKKAAKPIKLQDHENVKEQPVTIKAKEEVTSFEDKPSAIKVEEEASAEPTASQPASNSKDPKVLVAYLEEQLKSAPEMLVAYLTEQLKLAKEAVAAANVPTTNVVKRGDSSSSEGSSIMSESDSDSDVPPEETSIKPEAPVNVPPPRREAPTTRSKPVCLRFKKSGFCQFGKKCRYSHERNVQNQPRTSKPAPKPAIKPVRKSLHEVVSACLDQASVFADFMTDGGK